MIPWIEYDKFLLYSCIIKRNEFNKYFNPVYFKLVKHNFSRFWYYLTKELRICWLELADCNISLYDEYNKLIRYVYDISIEDFSKQFYTGIQIDLQVELNPEYESDDLTNSLFMFKHDIVLFWISLCAKEKEKLIMLINNHKYTIEELVYEKYSIQSNDRPYIESWIYTQEKVDSLDKNIKILGCANNNIESLDNLPLNITKINCSNNLITSLDNLPEKLLELVCTGNALKSVNNLPNNLIFLNVGLNKINNLDNLPEKLETLMCYSNQINQLNNLPCNLIHLDVSNNNITQLDNLPINLIKLICNNNSITKFLNLPPKLEYLSVNNNKFIKLNNLPDSLKVLICSGCRIISFDIMPPKLEYLDISSNNLGKFENIPKTLRHLNIFDCNISTLGKLPTNLLFLNASLNQIELLNLPKKLQFLGCDFAKYQRELQIIDLPDTLETIECCKYELRLINYFPNNLKVLYCDDDKCVNNVFILPVGIENFENLKIKHIHQI